MSESIENQDAGGRCAPPACYPRRTTEQEGALILQSICPSCFYTPLRAGPQGGMSQNVLCPKCHHEFYAAPVETWCEWIGVASDDRLAWPYGIKTDNEKGQT